MIKIEINVNADSAEFTLRERTVAEIAATKAVVDAFVDFPAIAKQIATGQMPSKLYTIETNGILNCYPAFKLLLKSGVIAVNDSQVALVREAWKHHLNPFS